MLASEHLLADSTCEIATAEDAPGSNNRFCRTADGELWQEVSASFAT